MTFANDDFRVGGCQLVSVVRGGEEVSVRKVPHRLALSRAFEGSGLRVRQA